MTTERRHRFKIGCQTYTWQMLGAEWDGDTDAMLDAIAAAGYEGVELTLITAGRYRDDPQGLAAACQARGLALVTLAYSTASGFTHPAWLNLDRRNRPVVLEYAVHAGFRTLGLGGACFGERDTRKQSGRAERVARAAARKVAAAFYTETAEIAAQHGLIAHLHPTSHGGSVIETPAEYDDILRLTDSRTVKFGPDFGHVLRGGGDPLALLRRYRQRVVHVHLKDVDAKGNWCPLGSGRCPTLAILQELEATDYDGWVMVEEESAAARTDPAAAVAANRAWLRQHGY